MVSEEICVDESEYECSTCEVDLEAGTASFDCAGFETCRDLASFCYEEEEEPLNLCYSYTDHGSVTSDEIWSYGSCTTLNTTQDDEMNQITICATYDYSPDTVLCTMEIDGIECTSCDENYFDCRNTRLGLVVDYSLPNFLNQYFFFRALSCPERCNFCSGTPEKLLGRNVGYTGGSIKVSFLRKNAVAKINATAKIYSCQQQHHKTN
ncbi:hypothetical protein IV203_032258 [Nitzschia inconspicua]|uniref:Uncharacterized protein n=1 Tax=Nitzschia inconspicua TaxID=303405 RepID=A0A9K3PEM1_9STRA|nr:hypothetical protein IV203_032258 [Nitzschia inconspicua]